VVNGGISFEIYVVAEVLIWSQKNMPYIVPSSEGLIGLVLPKAKK